MTFEELMRCHPDNPKNYNFLLKQARYHNITPFIGAGMTVWAGYPLWNKLLLKLSENIDGTPDISIKVLLGSNDENRYEQAASKILKRRGKRNFQNSLLEQYPERGLHESERPAYQKKLPELFQGVWVTTNFDHGVEELFGNNLGTVSANTQYNKNRIRSALHKHEPLLLKLHGDISDVENIILTYEDYNRVYAENEPMPEMLKQVFERNPVLFLGCSLEQDRTTRVLADCELGEQIAILQLPKETGNPDDIYRPIYIENHVEKKAWADRDHALSERYIFCIWYPWVEKEKYQGDIHNDALTALINHLYYDLKNPPNDPPNPPTISANASADSTSDMGNDESTALNTEITQESETSLSSGDVFLFRDKEMVEALRILRTPGERCAVVGAPGVGKTVLCQHVRAAYGTDKFPMVDLRTVSSLKAFYGAVAASVGQQLPESMTDEEAHDATVALLVSRGISAICFDSFESFLHAPPINGSGRFLLLRWMDDLKAKKISCLVSSREELPTDYHAVTIRLEAFTKEQAKHIFQQYFIRDMDKQALQTALMKRLSELSLADQLIAAQADGQNGENRPKTNRNEEAHAQDVILAYVCMKIWDVLGEMPSARLLWGVLAFGTGRMTLGTRDWLFEQMLDDLQQAENIIFHAHVAQINVQHSTIEISAPVKELFFRLADEEMKRAAVKIWFNKLLPCLEAANAPSGTVQQSVAHQRIIELLPDCLSILANLLNELKDYALVSQLDDALTNYYRYSPSSVQVLAELIQYYKSTGNDRKCAQANNLFGELMYRYGNPKEADSLYRKAETLFRKLGDNLGLANTLQGRGDLERVSGHPKEADSLYREAEMLYRKLGHDLGLTNTLQNRGDLEYVSDHPEEANRLYREAEMLYRKIGDNLGLANTLRSRGDLEHNYGDAKEADSLYREAEALFRKIGNDLGLANTLQSCGDLARKQASNEEGYRTAAALYEEAKALYEKVNTPMGLSYTCAELYECYTYLHETEKANAVREQGKALLDRVSQRAADYVREKLRL